MSKFNTADVKSAVFSPVKTESVASGHTFEGAPGYARDVKSELFLLAVSNMVGEDSFYEKAGERDSRYRELVREATLSDPEWTARLLKWLRTEANMRTASLVGAAEYTKARLDERIVSNITPTCRQVVDSVLQRADEPGEMLAYWTSTYGRSVPKPVKRGVADAVKRLYNERSFLKWDGDSKGYRFGDVIDLVHPTASAEWQGDLFAHALDKRHGRPDAIPSTALRMLHARAALMALPVADRRAILADTSVLAAAGMTWESLAGWLKGPMDAKAWEAVIPSMGYMALVRNLRNFDQAGVSDEMAAQVAAKLADPEQVARSRQLPLRFLSAYRAAPSLRWALPLEKAITHSLANVPRLKGRTLILVDTSGSMHAGFSKDGTLMRWDAAAVFGIALGSRCEQASVVSFSGGWGTAATKVFPIQKGESLLRSVDRWNSGGYFLGGGTETAAAIQAHLRGHDRLVILTDEQAAHSVEHVVPTSTALYTWNLAGYKYGHAPSGSQNRHTFGGLTDAAFGMIPLLEAGRNADWPF
jgi:hypothetical protein